jgi:hypothetical protein
MKKTALMFLACLLGILWLTSLPQSDLVADEKISSL